MVDTEDRVEADDKSFEDTDDKLFGTKSDSSSIASKSSDTHMEDVTKATSCIGLTDVDNTEGNKKPQDDQSSSVQGVPNLTTSKEVTKFLVEVKTLTVCPIIQEAMIHLYAGTDHQSYEKDSTSHWLGLYSKSHVTSEPMKTHCLMQDHTMNKLI